MTEIDTVYGALTVLCRSGIEPHSMALRDADYWRLLAEVKEAWRQEVKPGWRRVVVTPRITPMLSEPIALREIFVSASEEYGFPLVGPGGYVWIARSPS